MRIAVDCSLLHSASQFPHLRFPHLLRYLLQHYPGHEWLLAGPPEATKVLPGQHTTRLPMPHIPNNVPGRWLYRLKLSKLLQQQQADVWLGVAFPPPVLPLPIRNFWYAADALRGNLGKPLLQRLKMPALTRALPQEQNILVEYPVQLPDRVLPAALELPFFANPEELLMDNMPNAKEVHAGGKEYFLCLHGLAHVQQAIDLLLAFSVFKKRMRSGMKLIIAGSLKDSRELEQKLTTYRYRADVLWLHNPDAATMQALLLQAYALVQCHPEAGTHAAGMAIAAGIPSILPLHPLMQQVAGSAACYVSQTEPGENLAARLCLLYQNENYRSQLIQEGSILAAKRTLSAAAAQLMQYIERPIP